MLQFDEYKVKLNNLRPDLALLGESLDLESAERELDMLQAESASDGFWDNPSSNITVTNHSNVAVRVKMMYTALGNTGVKGVLTNATAELAAGEVGNYGGADSVTATLTVSGTPNSTVASDGVKVGTIKVTIN